jgi:DtxR family Mn-dependent transcriptional regulator
MGSLSEENHLKAIFNLSNGNSGTVSTSDIAEALHTKPASVSDMLKKLAQKKLIQYQKYQGVKLTNAGKQVAIQVIRKHRLWEVFLVEKLDFKWDEVHEVAEQLEHIHSDLLIERLDQYLGKPKIDPHGDPIPDQNGRLAKYHPKYLNEQKVGQSYIVVGVKDTNSALLKYLNKIGVSLGTVINIKEIIDFDSSLIVLIDNKEVKLTKEVAKNIFVKHEK